ncbi:MAG: polysaccharide pyruvyl transferase family protein, partial [Chlorobi bacterium]|nr:polysaccharide pyruvyl transferase family protein [Chlorobiota bacterium]
LDALSSIHVGNGVLLENSIALMQKAIPDSEFSILSMDKKTNEIIYNDVNYTMFGVFWRGKGKVKKVLWIVLHVLFVFIQIVNQYTFKIDPVKLSFNNYQRTAFRKIKESDVCISIIGEAINDNFYQALYFWLFKYWITMRLGKKFILLPQSIGPLNNRINKFFVYHFLKKADLLVARDEKSFEKLKELGFKQKQIAYSIDVGIMQTAEAASRYPVNAYFNEHKERKVIGLTLSKFPSEIKVDVDYLSIIINGIRKVVNPDDFNILIMPSNYILDGESNDYKLCKKAKHLLSQDYNVEILPNRVFFPKEYTTLLSQLYFFISTRMHVTILAASQYIPTLAVSSQHKITGFMRNIGQEELALQLDEIDRIADKIEYVISNRDDISLSIKNNVIEQKKSLEELVKRIQKVVNND